MATLPMHKLISVTGLMCGCRALLWFLSRKSGVVVVKKHTHTHTRPRLSDMEKQFCFKPEKCQKKKKSQDHGRISASAKGDLSGLTTLHFACPHLRFKVRADLSDWYRVSIQARHLDQSHQAKGSTQWP